MKGDARKEIGRNKIGRNRIRNSSSRIGDRVLSDIRGLGDSILVLSRISRAFGILPRGKVLDYLHRRLESFAVCTGYNMQCIGLTIFITQMILLPHHFLPLRPASFDAILPKYQY